MSGSLENLDLKIVILIYARAVKIFHILIFEIERLLKAVHVRTISKSITQKFIIVTAEENLGIGIKSPPLVDELDVIVMTVCQEKSLNPALAF